mmetsp:Transcript_24271/g.55275  ORF Transcript_24271/g.55275 Transcript_24271/m.55275 type:complete len:199 (-) Transcript_24271:695-1291(-)
MLEKMCSKSIFSMDNNYQRHSQKARKGIKRISFMICIMFRWYLLNQYDKQSNKDNLPSCFLRFQIPYPLDRDRDLDNDLDPAPAFLLLLLYCFLPSLLVLLLLVLPSLLLLLLVELLLEYDPLECERALLALALAAASLLRSSSTSSSRLLMSSCGTCLICMKLQNPPRAHVSSSKSLQRASRKSVTGLYSHSIVFPS